jgi:hypothetical protein
MINTLGVIVSDGRGVRFLCHRQLGLLVGLLMLVWAVMAVGNRYFKNGLAYVAFLTFLAALVLAAAGPLNRVMLGDPGV